MIYLDYNATTPVAWVYQEKNPGGDSRALCLHWRCLRGPFSDNFSCHCRYGVSREIGMVAIRLTLGRPTTQAEVDQVAEWIVKKVKR